MNFPRLKHAQRDLLVHGLMLGSFVGLLFFAKRYYQISSLPMGSQLKALAITWYTYGFVGLAATGVTVIATRFLLAATGHKLGNTWQWPPAAFLAVFMWTRVRDHIDSPFSMILIGSLAAIATFVLWTRITQYFALLQKNEFWISTVSFIVLMIFVMMVLLGTAEQGVSLRSVAMLLPLLAMQGVALWLCSKKVRSPNTIFTNSLLVIVSAALLLKLSAATVPPGSATNVIIISVDTLEG